MTSAVAAAADAARTFLAVPGQRDGAAAVFAALMALALVKACDVVATRDWLDRVRMQKGEGGEREGGRGEGSSRA